MNRLFAFLVLGTLAVGCGDVEGTTETQDPPYTVGEADAGVEPSGDEGDASSTEPEPEPDVTEPEPEPESDATEPEPEPDATEPEPESDATEPEPESDATEPESDATEPEPESDATEPEPESDATEPEPDAGPEEDTEAPCVPNCEGMACGDDGCGESCGECGDGDACNGVETCEAGQCVAGEAVVCDDENACNGLETCDGSTGECVAGEAVVCGDEDACNGLETCDGSTGECVAGEAVVCDDDNACNGVETCDGSTGECLAGSALSCDDGDPCNGEETCAEASGCIDGVALECDDGIACNGAEYCEADLGCASGQAPADGCDDANPCTEDICGLEGCTHTALADGVSCNDGVSCTGPDSCTDGVCSGAAYPQQCDDDDPCTIDSCDLEQGCVQSEVSGCVVAPCATPVADLDGASCVEVETFFEDGVPAAFTVEFWMQSAGADGGVLVDLHDALDVPAGFQLRLDEGGALRYQEETQVGPAEVVSLTELPQETWRHVALVRRADGTAQLFIDGQPEPPTSLGDPDVLMDEAPTGSLWVGCADGAGGHFTGAIDELRISDGERYEAAFVPPMEPLSADEATHLLFHFDDDADGLVVDSSPQGLDGLWQGEDSRPSVSPVADCSLEPGCEEPPCVGEPPPSWALLDKQPGPAYDTEYGLDAFDAKVMVLTLLSGS